MLKNVNPADCNLIFIFAHRLGIQVEEKPDHGYLVDDLEDAINEINMADAGRVKLQNTHDLIRKLNQPF